MIIKDCQEPQCELIDIRTGHRIEASQRIHRLVRDGWANDSFSKTIEREQKSIQEELAKIMGLNIIARIKGLCQARTRRRVEVFINNLHRLNAVIEDRYPDSEERINFMSDPYLLAELACDADDPISPRVRECLTISYQYRVEWEEE